MPSNTPATHRLRAAKIPFTVHTYAHREGATSYGAEAAAALGVNPERIFKTLVTTTGSDLVVAVVPVANSLDLKALAGAVGSKKVAMAEPAAAARSSGYVVGGISPIGQRTPLRTVIDSSVTSYDSVLVSGGRRGMQVELRPDDLVAVTGAIIARIAQ